MDFLRLMAKPVAVPQTTGSRMAMAGFSKTKLGRVKLGRWLVMIGEGGYGGYGTVDTVSMACTVMIESMDTPYTI